MNPSYPLLLTDVSLCCGMYPACKVDISQHLAIPRFPRVTILSASPVRTIVHCVVKLSRPSDLKSSSNIRLPFAFSHQVFGLLNSGFGGTFLNLLFNNRIAEGTLSASILLSKQSALPSIKLRGNTILCSWWAPENKGSFANISIKLFSNVNIFISV